jgi:hypothetical protein
MVTNATPSFIGLAGAFLTDPANISCRDRRAPVTFRHRAGPAGQPAGPAGPLRRRHRLGRPRSGRPPRRAVAASCPPSTRSEKATEHPSLSWLIFPLQNRSLFDQPRQRPRRIVIRGGARTVPEGANLGFAHTLQCAPSKGGGGSNSRCGSGSCSAWHPPLKLELVLSPPGGAL